MSNPGADQSNFFSEKGHIIFPILGTLGGLILLVGGYALWRGPHRQFFPCLNQRKREPLSEDEYARTRRGIEAWGGESAVGPMSGPGPSGGLAPPRAAPAMGKGRESKRSSFFARWSLMPNKAQGTGRGQGHAGREKGWGGGEEEVELGSGMMARDGGHGHDHVYGHGHMAHGHGPGDSGAKQVQRAYRQTMMSAYSTDNASYPGDYDAGPGRAAGSDLGAGTSADDYTAYHVRPGLRPGPGQSQSRPRSRSDFSRSSAGSVSRSSTLGGSYEAHALQPKIEEEGGLSYYASPNELDVVHEYGSASPLVHARALSPLGAGSGAGAGAGAGAGVGGEHLQLTQPQLQPQPQTASGYFALPPQTDLQRGAPGAGTAEGESALGHLGVPLGSPFFASTTSSPGEMGQNPFGTPPGEGPGPVQVHAQYRPVPPPAPAPATPLTSLPLHQHGPARLPRAQAAPPVPLMQMQMQTSAHTHAHAHRAQRTSNHFIQPARAGGRRDSFASGAAPRAGVGAGAYRPPAKGGGGGGGSAVGVGVGAGQRGTRPADRAPIADASDADVQFL